MACEEERIDTCKVLLKYGANPYLKNKVLKGFIYFNFNGINTFI